MLSPGRLALTTVLGLTLLSPPVTAAAQMVRGQLLESPSRRPIMLGKVALMDTTYTVVDETLTDHEGRFTVRAPGPGDYWIVGDRLGYLPTADGILELGESGYIEIEFFLRVNPIEIEGLTATATRTRPFVQRKLERQGFFQRQEAGFGYFIDPEEIEERMPMTMADLLRRIPRLRSGAIGGLAGCAGPRIYIDGAVMTNTSLSELDFVVGVQDIAAVEVYIGISQVPIEYGGLGSCGVILLWTG